MIFIKLPIAHSDKNLFEKLPDQQKMVVVHVDNITNMLYDGELAPDMHATRINFVGTHSVLVTGTPHDVMYQIAKAANAGASRVPQDLSSLR